MIIDTFVTIVLGIVTPVIGLLPGGHLNLPSASGFSTFLGGMDALIPILAPLQIALGVLAAVVVFIPVRALLLALNVVKP